MKPRISLNSLLLIPFLLLSMVSRVSGSEAPLQATPLVFEVLSSPLSAVEGSDGQYHLVYEIQITNISSKAWKVQRVTALAGGKPLFELSGAELKSRMGFLSKRGGSDELGPEQAGFLWMHLKFKSKKDLPEKFQHQFELGGAAKPLVIEGAEAVVNPMEALAIAAPLRGDRWLAGDGCCDSTRHVRATLPINGKLANSQRFAIDWEKLDAENRIYTGDAKNPENYICYGEDVLAVANAEVIAAMDGLSDQVPGKLPDSIDISQADGNHIILLLSSGHYALYAHLKPGSLRVKKGDRVQAGQVLAQIGNTGNTSEPHLHFHLMDGPSALASNGIPYVIQSFETSGKARSTESFDKAAADGTPLAIEAVKNSIHRNQLPLDLSRVNFPAPSASSPAANQPQTP